MGYAMHVQRAALTGFVLICAGCAKPDASGETKKELTSLPGHGAAVSCLAFSSDGKLLASGSSDKTIKIWYLPTGKELATLQGNARPVLAVAFSPDGRILASACDSTAPFDIRSGLVEKDDNIKLWDLKTSAEKRTLKGLTAKVQSLCFSPDGTKLGSSGQIKIWNVGTGKEEMTIDKGNPYCRTVAFSSDGKSLISSGGNTSNRIVIKIWDVASGRETGNVTGATQSVCATALSPDGKLAALGDIASDSIEVWEIAGGKKLHRLEARPGPPYQLAFSPDGKKLVSATSGTYNVIKLWDLSTGKAIAALEKESASCLAFSPDGQTVAFGSQLGSLPIMLWKP
jgi:WD40 repeat protein